MATVQIKARIEARLKQTLDEFCQSRGIVMNHFIQEAILDRLEGFGDIEDLKAICHEPPRPLAEVQAELKRDGALQGRNHQHGREATAKAHLPGPGQRIVRALVGLGDDHQDWASKGRVPVSRLPVRIASEVASALDRPRHEEVAP